MGNIQHVQQQHPTENHKVTVSDMHPPDTANNNILAECSITIDEIPIRIHGVRVMRGRDGHPWVAYPSRSSRVGGQIKWSPLVEIVDAPLKEAVTRAILHAFRQMDPPKPAPSKEGWWQS